MAELSEHHERLLHTLRDEVNRLRRRVAELEAELARVRASASHESTES